MVKPILVPLVLLLVMIVLVSGCTLFQPAETGGEETGGETPPEQPQMNQTPQEPQVNQTPQEPPDVGYW